MRVFNEILGVEVKLPETPSRIVSLAENLTETLFLLGLGDRVVGVSVYCRRPREASLKPRVGGYLEASIRRLRGLRPDLILTTSGAQRRLAHQLHREGFPVYPTPLPLSLHGILENVIEVGEVTGAVEEARRLVRALNQIIFSISRDSSSPKGRVYVELDVGEPVTIGSSSYLSHAFSVLGAENIFDGIRRPYFTPDFEKVELSNPEHIFYDPKPSEENPRRRFEKLVKERGWSNLKAVKSGRIHITRGDILAHYGPSFISETLRWIKDRLSIG